MSNINIIVHPEEIITSTTFPMLRLISPYCVDLLTAQYTDGTTVWNLLTGATGETFTTANQIGVDGRLGQAMSMSWNTDPADLDLLEANPFHVMRCWTNIYNECLILGQTNLVLRFHVREVGAAGDNDLDMYYESGTANIALGSGSDQLWSNAAVSADEVPIACTINDESSIISIHSLDKIDLGGYYPPVVASNPVKVYGVPEDQTNGQFGTTNLESIYTRGSGIYPDGVLVGATVGSGTGTSYLIGTSGNLIDTGTDDWSITIEFELSTVGGAHILIGTNQSQSVSRIQINSATKFYVNSGGGNSPKNKHEFTLTSALVADQRYTFTITQDGGDVTVYDEDAAASAVDDTWTNADPLGNSLKYVGDGADDPYLSIYSLIARRVTTTYSWDFTTRGSGCRSIYSKEGGLNLTAGGSATGEYSDWVLDGFTEEPRVNQAGIRLYQTGERIQIPFVGAFTGTIEHVNGVIEDISGTGDWTYEWVEGVAFELFRIICTDTVATRVYDLSLGLTDIGPDATDVAVKFMVPMSLTETIDNPNGFGTPEEDEFGNRVAICESYSLVSAQLENEASGTYAVGKAYIFDNTDGSLLYTLDNPNDYDTGTNDEFGNSVSICESYSLVGAQNEDESGGDSSGRAYIFDNSDGQLLYTLDNPNDYSTVGFDLFGCAVSICESYSLVGAYQEDEAGGDTSGRAYIFDNSDGTLSYTLDNPNDYGTVVGDRFGFSVAITESYSLVGAHQEDDAGGTASGKAYIFDNSDGTLLHTLDNPNDYDTSATDYFGYHLAICESYSIVSAYLEDDAGGTASGKAYIFDNSDGSLLHTLSNPNDYGTSANDNFGSSVAITEHYSYVSAKYEDDASNTTVGRVYVFDNSDGSLLQTIDDPNDYGTTATDLFGVSIAACDGYLISGASLEDDASNSDSGVAYLFSDIATPTPCNEEGRLLGALFSLSDITITFPMVGAWNMTEVFDDDTVTESSGSGELVHSYTDRTIVTSIVIEDTEGVSVYDMTSGDGDKLVDLIQSKHGVLANQQTLGFTKRGKPEVFNIGTGHDYSTLSAWYTGENTSAMDHAAVLRLHGVMAGKTNIGGSAHGIHVVGATADAGLNAEFKGASTYPMSFNSLDFTVVQVSPKSSAVYVYENCVFDDVKIVS